MVARTCPRTTAWPSMTSRSIMRPDTGALIRATRVSSASMRPATRNVALTSLHSGSPTLMSRIRSGRTAISSGLRGGEVASTLVSEPRAPQPARASAPNAHISIRMFGMSGFSIPQVDSAELLEIDEGCLTVKLCIQVVKARASQHALGIEHFDDAALSKAERGFGGVQGGFRLAQRSGFKHRDLTVCDLVLPVGALQRSGDLQTPQVGDRSGAMLSRHRLGDRTFALVPNRDRQRDSHPVLRCVGLAEHIRPQSGLRLGERVFEIQARGGAPGLVVSEGDSRMLGEHFLAQRVQAGQHHGRMKFVLGLEVPLKRRSNGG